MKLGWTALVFVLLLGGSAPARAELARYAIVVGDNRGDAGDVELRYAESDARRVASVLASIGGFHPENVTILTNITTDDLRRALITLNARLRQSSDPTLLFLFYSGHADAESLHLLRSHLPTSELRDLVSGSPADTRVLIVDSCRSGTLTRVKGGHKAPLFDIQVSLPPSAQGLAILTSSAAGEDSQESDTLRASFFTHHLVSALLGAADRDADGRITIDEAFAYAAERTVQATATTLVGPQHPTYRVELGGRDDLVLSQPGALRRDYGALSFPRAGSFLVQAGREGGPMVAELVTARPGGRLTVEAGRYAVIERTRDHLLQGVFVVAAGASTTAEPGQMRRIEYARVVRKGATERARAFSGFVAGGVRGAVLDLGTAWRTDVGARLDLPLVAVELRLGFGRSAHDSARTTIHSHELAASLAAVYVFDLSKLSLGVGLEVGGVWMAQTFTDPYSHARNGAGLFLAPIAQLEIPLYRRFYARVDGAFLTYFLHTTAQGDLATPVSYRASAGLGVYF